MTDILRCELCDEPTINEPYLGKVMCDDCTALLDFELERERELNQLDDIFLYELEL